jgi:acyl carrier protein
MTIQIMQTAEIEREIRNFVIDNFLLGRAEAFREDAVLLGGVIDSTGAVELIMFLQHRFSITVEDDEIAMPENFDSLKNAVSFVERKLSGKV